MSNNQERIKAALERIDNALASINSNEDWLKYLYFQSQFYNYSFGNTILIYTQNPQASYVKGYKAWNQLGRYVKKGAKGLAILAPCIRKVEEFKEAENEMEYHDSKGEMETKKVIAGFRVTYVFDILDTDGSDEYLPVLVTGLSGNGDKEKCIYEKLVVHISKKHTIKEIEGTASKGSYNLETKEIVIRSDLEYVQKIKTLLHEYAHAIDFAFHSEDSIKRNIRELIAESTAFIVAQHLGLDTSRYSVSYLKSWMKDKKELRDIAETVQKISQQIINEVAGEEFTSSSASFHSEEEFQ